MGLDQYGMIRNGHIDWKKVYSDKYEPTKDGFVWRKHARLQQFMSKEYAKQNPKEDTNEHSGNIDGLGFNGEDHKVIINKDILKRLDEAIKNDYYDHFAADGFFWGQQYQEEQAKSYKTQDKKVLIENFQGERAHRVAKIWGNTKVVTKGDDVIVTGMVLTDVTQTAAEIELKTKVKNKDHRVFLDGIYKYSKSKGIEK